MTAAARDLSRLLRPRSIAVIGGGFFGTNVVRQCLKAGYDGAIWPVHPTKTAIEGVSAYRSLDELPAAPDAAFIGVNRFLTVDMVAALAACGAGGAVCFASGFREAETDAEGAGLQTALVAAAGSMPLIGPNCYGLINYADGALLWPDQHGGERLPEGKRGAAILTQSSNIAINLTMQRRGLPLAYVMTAGNQAQTGLSDLALGLIEDPRVSVLGIHVEGFDSVSGFERLAERSRSLGKPVVAIKAGRSAQARRAAVSHTASLTGSDAASDAFLSRLGIARVETIPSFLEALKLLHVTGPLGGRRLSSMSCSGGEASVVADSAAGRRLVFPPLSPAHGERIATTLGPLVAIANPLDYHTFIWNDEKAMTATFSAMVSGGFDLNWMVLDFPRGDRCSDLDWWPTVEAFDTALKTHGAKGAIVASLPENLPETHARTLIARGIAPLAGIEAAMEAAEAAAAIGEAWARPAPPPLRRRVVSLNDGLGGSASGATTRRPDEADAKAALAAAGLSVPAGRRAGGVEAAVAAAEALGFPVAVKALGLAHKSESGAVRLGLSDAEAVRSAATAMAGLGDGLYVERMIEAGVAELIVGVLRDPVLGPVLTVGSGGVFAELLEDRTTLLLPATTDEIEVALRSLRLFPMLDGYRGRPKADLAAAIEAIAGIGAFALAHADRLEELEVNPLIVCEPGAGAWIADALVGLAAGEDDIGSGAATTGAPTRSRVAREAAVLPGKA